MTPAQRLIELGLQPVIDDYTTETFLRLCRENDLAGVQAYCELGMAVHVRAKFSGETPLIKAAETGALTVMRFLLEQGAFVDDKDDAGDTALRTAVNWQQPEAIRFLVASGADLQSVDNNDVGVLEKCIDECDHAMFDMLLACGAQPSVGPGAASLMRALLRAEDKSWLTTLLQDQSSFDANAKLGSSQRNALHWAFLEHAFDVVDLLVAAGASWDAKDRYGLTPRDYSEEINFTAESSEERHVDFGDDTQPLVSHRVRIFAAIRDHDQAAMEDVMSSPIFRSGWRDHEHKTLLMAAASVGNVQAIVALLSRGGNIREQDAKGQGVLAFVQGEHRVEIVERLIAAGARSIDGEPPRALGLLRAIWEEDVLWVKAYLRGSFVDDKKQKTALAEALSAAVSRSNLQLVQMLLAAGAPLNTTDNSETPLHAACRYYHNSDIVQALVDAGANVEARDKDGNTPLIALCSNGAFSGDERIAQSLRLLLSRGARLDAVNKYGKCAFFAGIGDNAAAVRKAMVDVVVTAAFAKGASLEALCANQNWASLLVWYEAQELDAIRQFVRSGVLVQPHVDDVPFAKTLLEHAVNCGDREMVLFLLEHGGNPNQISWAGFSVLGEALSCGQIDAAKMLLAYGADLHVRSDFHTTPVTQACGKYATPELLRFLRSQGADFATVRPNGPLLTLANYNNIAGVRCLVEEMKCPLHDVDDAGRNALDIAILKGNDEVAAYLVVAGIDFTSPRKNGDVAAEKAIDKGMKETVSAMFACGLALDAIRSDGATYAQSLMKRRDFRAMFAGEMRALGIEVLPHVPRALPSEFISLSQWWRAVYSGDFDAVEELVDRGEPIDERDEYGTTALMWAVAAHRVDIVELLLQSGAEPNQKDSEGHTAWSYAPFARSKEIDDLLESHGAVHPGVELLNVTATRHLLNDQLRDALQYGQFDRVRELIVARKLNPYTGVFGWSLLAFIVRMGDPDAFAYFLGLGLSPAIEDLQGNLPVQAAVERASLRDIVVQAGQLPLDKTSVDLLTSAIYSHDTSLALWLIKQGVPAQLRDKHGEYPIFLAIRHYLEDIAMEILPICNPRVKDESGKNLVELAQAAGLHVLADAAQAMMKLYDTGGNLRSKMAAGTVAPQNVTAGAADASASTPTPIPVNLTITGQFSRATTGAAEDSFADKFRASTQDSIVSGTPANSNNDKNS